MTQKIINASSETSLKSLISNVINQFVVRPLKGSTGISGFIFDVLGDEEIELSSEITDHYVEENYAVQDHIALRPRRFTVRGYVGELADIFPNAAISVLTNVQSLGTLEAFLPAFTAQASRVYGNLAAEASKIGQVINQAKNVYDIFTQKNTSSTKQQQAYDYFNSMWENRELCTVETPYAVLKDMAIENVRVRQRDESRFVSDFSVTFKMIRTTQTVTYTPQPLSTGTFLPSNLSPSPVFSGRAAQIISPTQFLGQTQGSTTLKGKSVTVDILSVAYKGALIS